MPTQYEDESLDEHEEYTVRKYINKCCKNDAIKVCTLPIGDQETSIGGDEVARSNRDFMDNDDESKRYKLEDLAFSADSNILSGLYSASMPKTSFLGSQSHLSHLSSTRGSFKNDPFGPISPRSFQTATSSLASYATAPSGPFLTPFSAYVRNYSSSRHREYASLQNISITSKTQTEPKNSSDLMDQVCLQVLCNDHDSEKVIDRREREKFRLWVSECLAPLSTSKHQNELGTSSINKLVDRVLEFRIDGESLTVNPISRLALSSLLSQFVLGRQSKSCVIPGQVFSSEWLSYLRTREILLNPKDELDWSGRGQHIEYDSKDESDIPLTTEKILGHSASAIVESVRCRRIRLARKMITCNRQLKKEIAITEVEHLQRLQHSHIVRVVGTYTLKRTLAILLYPVAEWNLDEFMIEVESSLNVKDPSLVVGGANRDMALETFFGCLSHALRFIHSMHIKHMDIKPKNLLVRLVHENSYKIYVADFGIARAYTSASDSETDTPTSFTRAYAAPEVVLQEKRGFSADVFSLGCVFIEILATIYNKRQDLLNLRLQNSGDTCFYNNIGAVIEWCHSLEIKGSRYLMNGLKRHFQSLIALLPRMIDNTPQLRPLMEEILDITALYSCSACNEGPEPFEVAMPL